jgi:glycosyltransferase involved in cell wall biosynthesis
MGEYGIHLLSPQPYNISKYCRPKVRRRLQALLEQEKYDVILCDFLVAAGVIPWDCSIPKVLFTHNVEATIWRKMDAAERRYLHLADHVLAVSETDRDAFAALVDNWKVTVVPTGVDLDYFQPMPLEEDANSLVFTGSMDWLPNEDAILYFADAILPLIKRVCPEVSLQVVGRSPSRRLQRLAETEASIQLTGRVDDIRPFVARGSVCIVPLRIGGGTRLKIFEAMAMGKAVISTSVGAEGLAVRSGEHILLADTPEDFARSAISLLQSRKRRQQLGAAAKTLVQESYSWTKVADGFARTLQDVITHCGVRPR